MNGIEIDKSYGRPTRVSDFPQGKKTGNLSYSEKEYISELNMNPDLRPGKPWELLSYKATETGVDSWHVAFHEQYFELRRATVAHRGETVFIFIADKNGKANAHHVQEYYGVTDLEAAMDMFVADYQKLKSQT